MADTVKQRKKGKKKEQENSKPPAKDNPTKEEYAVARWMRKHIAVKKTKFLNHTVEYFTACKAVDQLLESPWAQPSKPGEEALFTSRESIVEYMDVMLRHKLFHRARKIVVPESELKSKKKKDKDKEKDKDSDKDAKKVVKEVKEKESEQSKKKKEETVTTAAESSQAEEKADKEITGAKHKKEEGEKKKRKIRLDMHLQQMFVDGTDAYVWLYEPTPYYYYFFGFLVVIAVIAVCLFPLWPSSVRQGVYYLSLAAAGFLVFILALAVLRLVVFCMVWGITFGIHHLWLLPNLTEDVGFLASFWPLYKYEYKGDEVEVEEEEDGEAEGEGDENETNKTDPTSDKNATEEAGGEHTPLLSSETKEGTEEPRKGEDNSETESEGSQRSQTGKDFEIVDREEIEA